MNVCREDHGARHHFFPSTSGWLLKRDSTVCSKTHNCLLNHCPSKEKYTLLDTARQKATLNVNWHPGQPCCFPETASDSVSCSEKSMPRSCASAGPQLCCLSKGRLQELTFLTPGPVPYTQRFASLNRLQHLESGWLNHQKVRVPKLGSDPLLHSTPCGIWVLTGPLPHTTPENVSWSSGRMLAAQDL